MTVYAKDEHGAVSETAIITVVIIGENTENTFLGQTGRNTGFLDGGGLEKILYLVTALIAAIGAVLFWRRKKVCDNKNLSYDDVNPQINSQASNDRSNGTQEPSYTASASHIGVVFKEEGFTQSSKDGSFGMFCPT